MALKALSLIYQVAKLSEKKWDTCRIWLAEVSEGGQTDGSSNHLKSFFFPFFKSAALFQSVSNINLSQMVLCNKPSGTSGCNATGAEMLWELIRASLETLGPCHRRYSVWRSRWIKALKRSRVGGRCGNSTAQSYNKPAQTRTCRNPRSALQDRSI